MPRIALLVILFAVAVGVVFVVIKAFKGALVAHEAAIQRGGHMQRLAFFLLLALMAYVATSGAV